MKPLSLRLENVRTFQSLDFDFPEGACAITGPNGAGKSTLISALDVALFGAEGRSLADWLSRDRPEQTMVIALTFEHGGETYRVRRSFNGKGRGTSRVDFERIRGWDSEALDTRWDALTRESAAATQEEIERIIGLTRDTFRASAFMAQGDGGAFCEAQPRERKAILASLLGLSVWDGYRERARAKLRAAEQSLAVVRAKIEQAETDLAERPGLLSDLAGALARRNQAQESLAECMSQLGKARERLSKLREQSGLREAAERARAIAETSHASLLDRISALERQIGQADERLMEREALETLAEGLPALEAERDALAEKSRGYAERERLQQEARALAEKQEALLQASTKVLAGVGSERCDRCDQVLGEDAARMAAASLAGEANDLWPKEQALLNAALKLPAEPAPAGRAFDLADLIRLGQDAKAKLAALAEVEARRDAAQDELQKVRAELPERESAVSAARSSLLVLGPHDPTELQTAQRFLATHEAGEREAQKHVTEATTQIARLDERLARLDKLEADMRISHIEREGFETEVELLSHLERACGPNGVPALILETSAIPQMEAEWNRVLRLLPTESGDIFEVELHTQRERKSGDGAVDALDVIVYANGQARPYSTYSGGERMRIDIAQRRALSNLLAHRKGADCPLMILDEPNSLDDQGMAALAQVLEDLAASEGLTILVVSHDPALRDAFENSITVEKVDGRSRIAGTTEPAPTLTEVA